MRPVLYTFRRCPYAIRARLALSLSNIKYEHREVLLRDKPAHMLSLSPKGTVPVLQLEDRVIDESLDIMRWGLRTHPQRDQLDHPLVAFNDTQFKYYLDRYKYFDRYPEHPQSYYLDKALPFLSELESALNTAPQSQVDLGQEVLSPLGMAVLPFVRQFAMVDKTSFDILGFERLRCWLEASLGGELFKAVMVKKPPW